MHAGGTTITAQLEVDGERPPIVGEGNGPIEAFVARGRRATSVDGEFDVLDYAEHAIGQGADAPGGRLRRDRHRRRRRSRWGIGTDPNITTASLRAVLDGLRTPAR